MIAKSTVRMYESAHPCFDLAMTLSVCAVCLSQRKENKNKKRKEEREVGASSE